MGRNCGDIAMKTAMATGAEMLIVPEVEWDVDEVAARLNRLIEQGNTRATLVISEHCWDNMKPFDWRKFLNDNGKTVYPGEPISAEYLASILKRKCGGAEVRSTVIGDTQRGAQPTARDATFAFESGVLAVNLLQHGVSNRVIGMKHGKVYHEDIEKALKARRPFNRSLYNTINGL